MAKRGWLDHDAAPWARRATRLVSALVLVATFSACGGGDGDPFTQSATTGAATSTTPTASTSTAPATTSSASTTMSTTTTTTTTTSTTTLPTTTTTGPVDPVAACESYVAGLRELLLDGAEQLEAGAAINGDVADGTLSEADAVPQFEAVADEFGLLIERFVELGEAPTVAAPLSKLVGDSLVLFESAHDHFAQAAASGDGELIEAGSAELADGEALMIEVLDVVPDCGSAGATTATTTELATPSETDLTVFYRLAESVLATGSYAGTPPESLVAGAQASCEVLLAGGDIRSAIEAAIAASPVAGQPFGASEQTLVLLVVTRGANLWCPSVVGDEDAFASEVGTTIVDIFIEE